MIRPASLLAVFSLILACNGQVAADIVVPSSFTSTPGGTLITTVFQTGARTYQCQVASSLLTGLNVGDQITGITFRINSSAINLSSGAISWNNFDIKLGQATGSVANMTNNLTSNFTSAVQVRSGALSLAAGAYQGGAAPPNVNPFGYVLSFTTPYTYQGGDLVWQISHDAAISGTNFNLDAVSTSNSTAGYGTLFKAYTGSSYNATLASGATHFAVTEFTTRSGSVSVTSVPEPATWILGALAATFGGAGLFWSRRKRALIPGWNTSL